MEAFQVMGKWTRRDFSNSCQIATRDQPMHRPPLRLKPSSNRANCESAAILTAIMLFDLFKLLLIHTFQNRINVIVNSLYSVGHNERQSTVVLPKASIYI